MNSLNWHARALEIHREHPECPVAVIEAALREGAQRMAEQALALVRKQRGELEAQRRKANAPQ